jgi:hypothetical protein
MIELSRYLLYCQRNPGDLCMTEHTRVYTTYMILYCNVPVASILCNSSAEVIHTFLICMYNKKIRLENSWLFHVFSTSRDDFKFCNYSWRLFISCRCPLVSNYLIAYMKVSPHVYNPASHLRIACQSFFWQVIIFMAAFADVCGRCYQ